MIIFSKLPANRSIFSIQIGENCVVDPTSEEEECSAASIVAAVMPNGRITSIVKTGYGSLQPATLVKTLEVCD